MMGQNYMADTEFTNSLCRAVQTRLKTENEPKSIPKGDKVYSYQREKNSTYSQYNFRQFQRKYQVTFFPLNPR